MSSPTNLILHNYDFSNYAEKARLALGYKGLPWLSVTIPPVAPKPELMPLTGGYRRTPVLQIGADIFCDTKCILRELERRQPDPTFYPVGYTAIGDAIAYWAEHQLFRPTSLYVSGRNLDLLPHNLQADRSRMRGLPVPDQETVRRAARRNAPAVRLQIVRVDEILSDGRDWIAGPAVTVGDFAVFHALWFITARSQRLAYELTPYPRILGWMERMRAFGHGSSSPLTAAEALDIAQAASPAALRASKPFAEDPQPGEFVSIRADDYGKDSIKGELVLIDTEEIAIRRRDDRVGDVVVYFPRLGYDLRAVSS